MYTTIANFLGMTPEQVKSWLDMSVMRHKTLSLDFPEFTVSFITNLPIERFDKYLKLNRAWYKECKRELEVRRQSCITQYWETVEEHKKAHEALDDCWKNGTMSVLNNHYQQCYDLSTKTFNKKTEDFGAWVQVDKAILRCDFPDLIDHADPRYYIEMYGFGFDPYEIPTPDNDPENILGYRDYEYQDEISDSDDEDSDA